MNFSINTKTFVRLASVTSYFSPSTDLETRTLLECVRIECRSGHAIAIASNQKIAVIEHLGQVSDEDAVVHIKTKPSIVEHATKHDKMLQIVVVPEFGLGSAATDDGFTEPDACLFPAKTPLESWRTWVPKSEIKRSKGFMCWNVDHLRSLAEASPSGDIYFPSHIDVDQPVIIRDRHDPSWVGLFMARLEPDEKPPLKPADLPAWWHV